MIDRSTLTTAPLARWSFRIAVFMAAVAAVGVVLHRLASFPTPVVINLLLVVIGGSILAVLAGLIAMAQIWRRGLAGAGAAAVGILLPLAMLAWPMTYLPAYFSLPKINDITTDPQSPPAFVALAAQRGGAANAAAYTARFAPLQQAAYPDLHPIVIDRSPEEAFELVVEAVYRLRWRVVAATPPSARPARPGTLEAVDQTLIIGFPDDISIRIDGSAGRARIDIRSASRYGRADFGQNAMRVRQFFAELRARLDTTAPDAIVGRRSRRTRAGALLKRLKARGLQKEEPRSAPDRAQPSAPRGRAPRETQR
jgi:uncharacterized protein (DUF1499 family)